MFNTINTKSQCEITNNIILYDDIQSTLPDTNFHLGKILSISDNSVREFGKILYNYEKIYEGSGNKTYKEYYPYEKENKYNNTITKCNSVKKEQQGGDGSPCTKAIKDVYGRIVDNKQIDTILDKIKNLLKKDLCDDLINLYSKKERTEFYNTMLDTPIDEFNVNTANLANNISVKLQQINGKNKKRIKKLYETDLRYLDYENQLYEIYNKIKKNPIPLGKNIINDIELDRLQQEEKKTYEYLWEKQIKLLKVFDVKPTNVQSSENSLCDTLQIGNPEPEDKDRIYNQELSSNFKEDFFSKNTNRLLIDPLEILYYEDKLRSQNKYYVNDIKIVYDWQKTFTREPVIAPVLTEFTNSWRVRSKGKKVEYGLLHDNMLITRSIEYENLTNTNMNNSIQLLNVKRNYIRKIRSLDNKTISDDAYGFDLSFLPKTYSSMSTYSMFILHSILLEKSVNNIIDINKSEPYECSESITNLDTIPFEVKEGIKLMSNRYIYTLQGEGYDGQIQYYFMNKLYSMNLYRLLGPYNIDVKELDQKKLGTLVPSRRPRTRYVGVSPRRSRTCYVELGSLLDDLLNDGQVLGLFLDKKGYEYYTNHTVTDIEQTLASTAAPVASKEARATARATAQAASRARAAAPVASPMPLVDPTMLPGRRSPPPTSPTPPVEPTAENNVNIRVKVKQMGDTNLYATIPVTLHIEKYKLCLEFEEEDNDNLKLRYRFKEGMLMGSSGHYADTINFSVNIDKITFSYHDTEKNADIEESLYLKYIKESKIEKKKEKKNTYSITFKYRKDSDVIEHRFITTYCLASKILYYIKYRTIEYTQIMKIEYDIRDKKTIITLKDNKIIFEDITQAMSKYIDKKKNAIDSSVYNDYHYNIELIKTYINLELDNYMKSIGYSEFNDLSDCDLYNILINTFDKYECNVNYMNNLDKPNLTTIAKGSSFINHCHDIEYKPLTLSKSTISIHKCLSGDKHCLVHNGEITRDNLEKLKQNEKYEKCYINIDYDNLRIIQFERVLQTGTHQAVTGNVKRTDVSELEVYRDILDLATYTNIKMPDGYDTCTLAEKIKYNSKLVHITDYPDFINIQNHIKDIILSTIKKNPCPANNEKPNNNDTTPDEKDDKKDYKYTSEVIEELNKYEKEQEEKRRQLEQEAADKLKAARLAEEEVERLVVQVRLAEEEAERLEAEAERKKRQTRKEGQNKSAWKRRNTRAKKKAEEARKNAKKLAEELKRKQRIIEREKIKNKKGGYIPHYSYIIHPISKNKINIESKEGKQLLNNYLNKRVNYNK